MEEYVEPSRELDVLGKYDVVVVGGGPAGLVAATASGRNDAKTLLVERFGYLGGTATASVMINVNGFRNQVEPDSVQTVKGVAQEIILELHRMNGLGRSPYKQREYPVETGELSYSYCVDPEKFKYVSLKLAHEAGVDIHLHTYFSDAIKKKNDLKGVIVENKSGRQAILAKVTVDAPGDRDVAARAGASYWQADHSAEVVLKDNIMYKISGIREAEFGNCRYNDSSVDRSISTT
jgi:flavin-dependent dehydrogenase